MRENQGFRPGPTQTGLYSHRGRLVREEEGCYYLCTKNKGTDQQCSYCRADLHLCFCTCQNPFFMWCSSKRGYQICVLTLLYFTCLSVCYLKSLFSHKGIYFCAPFCLPSFVAESDSIHFQFSQIMVCSVSSNDDPRLTKLFYGKVFSFIGFNLRKSV